MSQNIEDIFLTAAKNMKENMGVMSVGRIQVLKKMGLGPVSIRNRNDVEKMAPYLKIGKGVSLRTDGQEYICFND